jgi:hypothetical protein
MCMCRVMNAHVLFTESSSSSFKSDCMHGRVDECDATIVTWLCAQYSSAEWGFTYPMKITIELAGDKTEFDVEEEDTVVCLKIQVQAKQLQQGNAVRVDQIKLVWNGQQLNDSETFTSQHIVAGSAMHMILERDGPGGAMKL